MSTRTKGRHRKDAPVVTSVAPVARRSLAVAASSGLALAMITSAAQAASAAGANTSAGSLEAGGVNAIAANARAAVTTNAALTVSPNVSTPAVVTSDVAESEAEAEAPASVVTPAVTQTDDDSRTGTDTGSTDATNVSQAQKTDVPASSAGGAVGLAMNEVGKPYVSGAAGPDAFDCSGLVQYVYAQLGINLPRVSYAQGAAGTPVSAAEAQPGDLVYYGYHIGIYAGNGMMIDAGTESTGVVYREVWGSPQYIRVA